MMLFTAVIDRCRFSSRATRPSTSASHFSHVNYEDPNFNVAMPVFSIHGNHDDLSGKGLSELDVLHESGLLNLFGKFENCTEAFLARNVRFLRPNEEPEQWFSVMAFHQNRPHRAFDMKSIASHIPEHYLRDFLDFVVWGHEHECKNELVYELVARFRLWLFWFALFQYIFH